MRRFNKLVTADFNRSIGLFENDFSDASWYTLGKILRGDYGTNSYEAVLLIKNVGCDPIDSQAIVTIKFKNNKISSYINTPFNHGTFVTKLSNDEEYYTIYYRPELDFIGKRSEITILQETGDINRAIYYQYPIQQFMNSNSFTEVEAVFRPDDSFNTVLTNLKDTDLGEDAAAVFIVSPNSSGYIMIKFSVRYMYENSPVILNYGIYKDSGVDSPINAILESATGINYDAIKSIYDNISIMRYKIVDDRCSVASTKGINTTSELDSPLIRFDTIIGEISSTFGGVLSGGLGFNTSISNPEPTPEPDPVVPPDETTTDNTEEGGV